jgi:hypothetical protein
MEKVEYGDLNRFFVSLGLAVIAGSIGALWLFLKEPFDLGRTVDQLSKLTPVAREIILQRQEITAATLRLLPYIAASSFVLGVLLIGLGVWRWIPSHRVQEQLQETELERQKKELEKLNRDSRSLSPVELVKEVEANVILSRSLADTKSEAHLVGNTREFNSDVSSYLHVEKTLLDTLGRHLPGTFELIPEQAVGPYRIDAFIRSRSDPTRSYVVEIKYLRSDSEVRLLKGAIQTASNLANWLKQSDYGRHVPLVIAVAADLTPNLIEEANRIIAGYAGDPTAFGSALLRLMPQERLEKLSDLDVGEILDIGSRFVILGDPRRQ